MKLNAFLVVLFFQISLSASTIEVVGACSATPLFVSEDLLHEPTKTLGDLTIEIFDQNKIPYRGSNEGIVQIFNSAVGEEAIETLSHEKTRFYGWCVHVNDIEPGVMPDQVVLVSSHSKIKWFYAYATVFRGQWTEMCQPAHLIKSPKFCL